MLLLVVCLSNISNAAQDYGTVTAINGTTKGAIGGNETENVVLEFDTLDLSWAKKENASGSDSERYKNGWWIGIKVTAPDNADKSNATFKRKQYGEDWSADNSFDKYKDDTDYINLWAYLDNDILNANKSVFTLYEVKFDWKNSKPEQNITIKIDPTSGKLDLKTDGSDVSKIHVVDLGIGATQTKKTFTMEKDKTLAEGLSASEKASFDAYKKIAGFVEFYKFAGASYDFKTDKLDSYKGNKFDPEKDQITEEEVTIVAYINNPTPVLNPTNPTPTSASAPASAPAPAGEKDSTPKTGVTDIVCYVVAITVFSAMGIFALKNKSKNY